MPAGSDVQWLVGPLHDNFRYIGASNNYYYYYLRNYPLPLK